MKRALVLVLCSCWTGSTGPARIPDPNHRGPAWATTELMLDLAAKPRRVLDFVDGERGLVFLDHYHGPGEDVPEPRGDQHLCGAALEKFVRGVWAREIAAAITAGRRNGKLACTAPGAGTCTAGGAGEWDPVLRFHFVRDGASIALRAVTIADEVLVTDDAVAAERAAQDRTIERLSSQPCPSRR